LSLKDGSTAMGSHNTVTGCNRGAHLFVKTAGQPGGAGVFHSSIIWGNGRDVELDTDSRLELDHSDVGLEPGRWGKENFSADPRFAGPGDYRLRAGSPCLGAGRDGSTAGALGLHEPRPPEVGAVEPPAGAVGGGVVVTISGRGLEATRSVRVGGERLADLAVLATGAVRGIVPPASRAGAAAIEVVTGAGRVVVPGGFRYTQGLLRGDVDGDLRLSASDAVRILRFLFAGGEAPECPEIADFDADSETSVADAVSLLRYLFAAGQPPDSLRVDCEV
jgi:hypothetical protein